jgi:polyhydroxybutyrate depolymerase
MPLILDFHGYLEGAKLQSRLSDLGRYGETHGFITVTPEGKGTPVQWDPRPRSADMRYVGHLLDEVEAQLCVDTKRVFATGLSNGAIMTSAVACVYADRVAAVAPVAGIQGEAGCTPSRPVPIVAFHGTADPYISYTGGLGPSLRALPASDGTNRSIAQAGAPPGWQLPNVPAAAAAWAARNGCTAVVASDERVTSDVTLRTFGCAPQDAVELYTIHGGGHTWPGSPVSASLGSAVGRTTMSISADDIMWNFFMAHPMP